MSAATTTATNPTSAPSATTAARARINPDRVTAYQPASPRTASQTIAARIRPMLLVTPAIGTTIATASARSATTAAIRWPGAGRAGSLVMDPVWPRRASGDGLRLRPRCHADRDEVERVDPRVLQRDPVRLDD